MHIRTNINGQGLVQSELVQMSTFSTDMACFGYEIHFLFNFFAPLIYARSNQVPRSPRLCYGSGQ